MSNNVQRLLRIKARNLAKKNNTGFQKMILQKGDNKFQIVGGVKVVFEHWFKDANNNPVHSICTRDYEAEENGEEKNYCLICKMYNDAWTIFNNTEDNSVEEIEMASIMIGQKIESGKKYKTSWRAKEFAYMNVISFDSDWCKENKKTMVLCKSEAQSGISAGTGGILDEIMEIVEEYGEYEGYVIRLKKTGDKQGTSYRGYKEKDRAFTPEEKEYDRFNFDLIKPTEEQILIKWVELGAGKDSEKKSELEKKSEPEKKKIKVTRKLKVKTPEPKKVKEEMAECPKCETILPATSDSCPKCGQDFSGLEEVY